ncbi:MAG: glycine/betaine ABC transporter substrate-binding protein [Actinobacteria bacterium]|nr:MAG: glycine/betaine ABC transporter substrate-binding protein [Actinomycetota bacterium]
MGGPRRERKIVHGRGAGGEKKSSGRALSRRDFLRLGGAGLAGAALLGTAGCGGTASSSGGKTLTVGNIGWDENVAVSNLTKVLLEEDLGYEEVKLQTLDVGVLFQSVANGDLDMFQDVWTPLHDDYLKELGDELEHLPPWYKGEAKVGLGVPSYMGVGNIAQLNGTGAQQIIGIEPGSEVMRQIKEEVIPRYGLEQELIESSTAGMLAQVERSYKARDPFVFVAWTPHWMNEKYRITYLEDPEGALGPAAEPAELSSVLRKGLADDDPAAHAFMKELALDEGQLNGLEAAINEVGADKPAEGVKAWLEDNRNVVQPWVDAAEAAA